MLWPCIANSLFPGEAHDQYQEMYNDDGIAAAARDEMEGVTKVYSQKRDLVHT